MDKNIEKNFINLQAEFYQYMITLGELAPKTARDYITRLTFLSSEYNIDNKLTKEKIDEILNKEENKQSSRSKYTSKKSLSDFRSGLNKYLAFVNTDYKSYCEEEIVTEVKKVEISDNLSNTEKETIIKARIGQGLYRRNLIKYWNGCSLTQCDMKDILIASHIKPWSRSNNNERIDTFNGLLLLPNYDKLFDLGYITIDLNGSLLLSKFLSGKNRQLLIHKSISLIRIDERHKPYLDYHNQNCFMG